MLSSAKASGCPAQVLASEALWLPRLRVAHPAGARGVFRRSNVPMLSNKPRIRRLGVGRVVTEALASSEATSPSHPHRTVVYTVDGTKDAEEGLRWTSKHMLRKGDTVYLVHVLSDLRNPFSGLSRTSISGTWTQASGEEAYMVKLQHDAEAMLESRYVPLVTDAGVTCHKALLQLQTGRSAAAIGELLSDAAVRLGASLLILPSHGPGAMADYGSVSRWCQDHSRVPVVLLPPAVLRSDIDGDVPAESSMIVAGPIAGGLERLHKAFVFSCRRLSQPDELVRVIGVLATRDAEVAAEKKAELEGAVERWLETAPSDRHLTVSVDVMCDAPVVMDEGGSRVGITLCDLAADTKARGVTLVRHGDDLASQLQFAPLTTHVIKHCTRPLIVLDPVRNLSPIVPQADVVEAEERRHQPAQAFSTGIWDEDETEVADSRDGA